MGGLYPLRASLCEEAKEGAKKKDLMSVRICRRVKSGILSRSERAESASQTRMGSKAISLSCGGNVRKR